MCVCMFAECLVVVSVCGAGNLVGVEYVCMCRATMFGLSYKNKWWNRFTQTHTHTCATHSHICVYACSCCKLANWFLHWSDQPLSLSIAIENEKTISFIWFSPPFKAVCHGFFVFLTAARQTTTTTGIEGKWGICALQGMLQLYHVWHLCLGFLLLTFTSIHSLSAVTNGK